mgnify:FL=1
MSPDGSGPLSFERGVEIGQVFQLGLKYSNALGLKVLDQNGKTVPVWMGSYGIGVSRVMACIAETHHERRVWRGRQSSRRHRCTSWPPARMRPRSKPQNS